MSMIQVLKTNVISNIIQLCKNIKIYIKMYIYVNMFISNKYNICDEKLTGYDQILSTVSK